MRLPRSFLRAVLCLVLCPGLFLMGRVSAYGPARHIPMTADHFLIGMGMVKVTVEALNTSQDRLLQIVDDQARGRYTRTQAQQMIQAERGRQESQVAAAVSAFLGRNAQIDKTSFTVPPAEMTEEMLLIVEYVQTKYPSLFSRYMN